MIATQITPQVAEEVHKRRAAGDSHQTLAASFGLNLDDIWAILYPVQPPTAPPPAADRLPQAPKAAQTMTLTERYRPLGLDGVRGQERATTFLKALAKAPFPCALLFEGETGTGKTSAAMALATAVGCDPAQGEFGGLHNIGSGEQTADAVRDTFRQLWFIPMYGSGWKVAVINEADRMTTQAETVWLDRLEALPPRTIIVFTTNHADKLTSRLRDRCTRLKFEASASKLRADVVSLLSDIWQAQRPRDCPNPNVIERIASEATEDGCLSFRRAVQLLATELMVLE